MLLLEGGRVVCPVSGQDGPLDVLVDEDAGRIAAVGPGLSADPRAAGAMVIDARGAVVSPGLVDLGATLCDPGQTWREDLQSGSEAAAAGGFTTVVASPRTQPVVDCPAVLRDVLTRAAEVTGARVLQAGALTAGLKGEDLAEVGLLHEAGAIALSDGGVATADTGVLRRALDYARPFGLPVLLRPQDPSLATDGVMHEGAVSLRIGLRGEPAEAEEIGVQRIVALARLTGARVHLSHVTTARGLALVARARSEGLAVTASAPARNLVLCDADIEASTYDPHLRVSPPLRTAADRAALIEAVRSGAITLHSDHVPWTRVGKELEFAYAKPGALGLETALKAALTALDGDASAVVRALCVGPAALLGFAPSVAPEAPADLVVFDPQVASALGPERRSRGCNEPLTGRTLRGCVRATVVAGRVVYGPIPAVG